VIGHPDEIVQGLLGLGDIHVGAKAYMDLIVLGVAGIKADHFLLHTGEAFLSLLIAVLCADDIELIASGPTEDIAAAAVFGDGVGYFFDSEITPEQP